MCLRTTPTCPATPRPPRAPSPPHSGPATHTDTPRLALQFFLTLGSIILGAYVAVKVFGLDVAGVAGSIGGGDSGRAGGGGGSGGRPRERGGARGAGGATGRRVCRASSRPREPAQQPATLARRARSQPGARPVGRPLLPV